MNKFDIKDFEFTKEEFNRLDDPLDNIRVEDLIYNSSQRFNYEEIFTKILLKKDFDTDFLIDNIYNDNYIVEILYNRKDLTLEQKLKLFNKVTVSNAIFQAILTFSQEELYDIVKLPKEYSIGNLQGYIQNNPYKYRRTMLICYLYLYPSKKKLSKEKTKMIFTLLITNFNNYCYPLITTERFLSNFSKQFRNRLFLKEFANINVKLFSYIDKIPDELYERSLNNMLKKIIPIDILLYAKCFQKDYKSFFKDIDMDDFYKKMYNVYTYRTKDILTLEQFHYCIQHFMETESKEFYKLLPKFIKYEQDEDRKEILNSYVLLEDLQNV